MADVAEVKPRGGILGNLVPSRYVLSVMAMAGMSIIYGLRVNISTALVAMVNHTGVREEWAAQGITEAPPSKHDCQGGQDEEGTFEMEDGPFIWSSQLQGTMVSCYFWGYLVAMFPGGVAAELLSAKWVFLFAVAINAICTLITPIVTKIHYVLLIVMRILQGLGGGPSFPCMHCMIAAWSPPVERSVISGIIYSGCALGTFISILMTGMLAKYFGWEMLFYVEGGLSLIWCVIWFLIIDESPATARYISADERQYILAQQGPQSKSGKRPPLPWGKILTSLPFWAIFVANCCSNYGWYMLLLEVPFYMKQVLDFSIKKNAMLTALPYIPHFMFTIILGKVLDHFRSKKKLTTGGARKIGTGIASLIPCACLIALCFIGCRPMLAVLLMATAIVAFGAMFSGFMSNHIDIAPNYAASLMGITNTFGTIGGIVAPILVGYVTEGNETIEAWRLIFFSVVVLLLVEFIVFTIWGSGEEQSWNKSQEKKAEK